MTDSTPSELDQILARLFGELEHAADREEVIQKYCHQYPQHAAVLREISELDGILAGSTEEVEPPLPERLGDFRIVRRIDKGGMGIICEAIQEPLNRRVAVKIIRRGRTRLEHRKRFLREQRVLASLHQTHIVPVFASGEEGPIQYFAMPYIEGAALQHVIRATRQWQASVPGQKTPPLSQLVERAVGSQGTAETEEWNERAEESSLAATETLPGDPPRREPVREDRARREAAFPLSLEYYRSVATIMADAADALQHVHEHGFVHRDVKPANIMVDAVGQSWIIDFGLAGHLRGANDLAAVAAPAESHATPLHSRVAGTPGYAAPEQEEDEKGAVDPRADVWGLGAALSR